MCVCACFGLTALCVHKKQQHMIDSAVCATRDTHKRKNSKKYAQKIGSRHATRRFLVNELSRNRLSLATHIVSACPTRCVCIYKREYVRISMCIRVKIEMRLLALHRVAQARRSRKQHSHTHSAYAKGQWTHSYTRFRTVIHGDICSHGAHPCEQTPAHARA